MIQDIIREYHEQVLLEVFQERIQQSNEDYKQAVNDFKLLIVEQIKERHKLIDDIMNRDKSQSPAMYSFRDLILFERILKLNQMRKDRIEILKSLEEDNGPYE